MKRLGLLLCLGLIFTMSCGDKKRRRGGVQNNPTTSESAVNNSGGSNSEGGGGGGGGGGGSGGGGGGGGGGEPAPPSCDYSGINDAWWTESDPVWYFNAKFYSNRTVRWKRGIIKVMVFDERISVNVLNNIFAELNSYIAPSRLELVNNNYDLVIFRNQTLPENSGLATWSINNKHRIYQASIEMADFNSDQCYFYAVLKHHLIRSLGIFDYTQDGGVMMATIPNDYITTVVAATLVSLYNLKAGTLMTPNGVAEGDGGDHDDDD